MNACSYHAICPYYKESLNRISALAAITRYRYCLGASKTCAIRRLLAEGWEPLALPGRLRPYDNPAPAVWVAKKTG